MSQNVKFKQVGQNLTLVYTEIGEKKPNKISVKVADKEERDAMLKKINGYLTKIDKAKSELVIAKTNKTLVNLFTKKGTAIKKAKEAEKVKAKAKIKVIKKKNKPTVKAVTKKTSALSRIQKDVAKLNPKERAELLASLGTTKQIAQKAESTPKTPAVRGRRRGGEY